MRKSQIESKSPIGLLLFVFIVGTGMITASVLMFKEAFETPYPQIVLIILGTLFGLLGLVAVIYVLIDKKIVIDDEKITIKSIFNTYVNSIYISDIKSYYLNITNHKGVKWEELVLQTSRTRIKISSTVSNYSNFKSAISRQVEYDTLASKARKLKIAKRVGIILSFIGIVMTIIILITDDKKYIPVEEDQLTSLTVSIIDTLKIHKSKNSTSIKFPLKEYPEFVFRLYGINYSASRKKELIEEIAIGHQVEIQILKDTYEKKLSKTKEPTFFEKTVNYKFIQVYGLTHNGKQYISLKGINYLRNKDSEISLTWLYLAFSIGMVIFGIYLFRLKPSDY